MAVQCTSPHKTDKRGHQVKMQIGLKTEKMCKYFHLQASHGSSINLYATEVLFTSNLCSPGYSHAGSLFTSKERLACYVINTSATHANFITDVTDTDCQTHNDSTHSHVSVAFKYLFLAN